jgi:hypothetical protein
LANGKIYEIEGDKTEITDFVLDKNIKITASGKSTFDKQEQFSYNIKITNKIMPELNLHDLVFAPIVVQPKKETSDEQTYTAMQYSALSNINSFIQKVSASAEPAVTGTPIAQLDKRLELLKL